MRLGGRHEPCETTDGAGSLASRRVRRIAAIAVSLIACAALAACDDDAEPEETTAPPPVEEQTAEPAETTEATTTEDEDEAPEPEATTQEEPETAPASPPRSADEEDVARAVRTYLLALDAGDGAEVCSLLADPGAVEGALLPKPKGDCAESISASIGARDPRGLPVFEGLRLAGIRAIQVQGDSARARATTVTTFADREEPSIEDDIVYLIRVSDEWRIAKPSAAFYRAIGAGDVPPSVISPPPEFDGR
jgi:hypothetical protein